MATLALRQSCDRCHQRKVRCLQSPQRRDSSGKVHACIRCSKAGAACVYSVKQKPGRPLVPPSDAQSGPSTTRSRPADRQRQSNLFYTLPSPSSPCSAGAPRSALASDSLVDLREAGAEAMFLTSDTGSISSPDLRDYLHGNGQSGWALDFLSADAIASFARGGAVATTARSPGDADSGLSIPGSASTTLWDNEPPTPASELPHSERLEAWVGRLADLNVRVLRSAQDIASQGGAPLTASSPHVEGIYEATGELIRIIYGLGQCYATGNKFDNVSPKSKASSASSPVAAAAPDTMLGVASIATLDRGLVYLVLAAHQRLLNVFETVCCSIEGDLLSMNGTGDGAGDACLASLLSSSSSSSSAVPAEAYRSVADKDGSSTPSMAQFAMVTQLLGRLLTRLDRVLTPRSESGGTEMPEGLTNMGTQARSWRESEELTGTPDLLVTMQSSHCRETETNGGDQGSENLLEMARHFVGTTQAQHTRLRQVISRLQKWIEQSKTG